MCVRWCNFGYGVIDPDKLWGSIVVGFQGFGGNPRPHDLDRAPRSMFA